MSTPLIVALDYSDYAQLKRLLKILSPKLCRLKVGSVMFTRYGPDLITDLVQQGFDVFLDLKFHDIPNTVYAAIAAACELGVWMVNVHAAGGMAMLTAAKEAVNAHNGHKPLLIAVTLLTSLEAADLKQVAYSDPPEKMVMHLAEMALSADFDGLVCSAHEAPMLRAHLGDKPVLVTPGIRSEVAAADQKRVMSPEAALAAGSNFLVMGREITQADNPQATLEKILEKI